MDLPSYNMLDKFEEQKINSPKSAVSVSQLVKTSNQEFVEYFDQIDAENK